MKKRELKKKHEEKTKFLTKQKKEERGKNKLT